MGRHPTQQELTKPISWMISSMMLVSALYALFYIPTMSLADVPMAIFITVAYGLIMAFSFWGVYAGSFVLINGVLRVVGKRFHSHLPFEGITAAIGTNVGIFFGEHLKGYIYDYEPSFSGGFIFVQGIFIGFAIVFWRYFKTYKSKAQALEKASLEAEYRTLKNQMQPHFLFNSLNGLSELIETNQGSAVDMAMKLSDLYREILENSKKPLVSLASEISIVEKYLELEQLRFGERLGIFIDVPTSANNIWVPPLVLQTLVENAVKHGVAPSVDGGQIAISIKKGESSGYDLSVVNPGSFLQRRGGTGLKNTKERLSLLYGDKHNFQIYSSGNQVKTSFWFSGEPIYA